MKVLRLFNRQKTRAIQTRQWRKAAAHLLQSREHQSYELAIHLIGAEEMAGLNEKFLGHTGSTDVITFEYQSDSLSSLDGEIFISMDDAVSQARQFSTTWQSEIVRYLAHAILHLEGYDDLGTATRRVMKREENKLVKELSGRFDLGTLGPAKTNGKRK